MSLERGSTVYVIASSNTLAHLFPCSVLFVRRVRQSKASGGTTTDAEPVASLHPEAARAESIVRNAWADAKLVAD